MKLHLHTSTKLTQISSCTNHESGFKIMIEGQCYTQSLFINLGMVHLLEQQTLASLTEQHFELFSRGKPEVILLGTGAKLIFPEQSITKPLINSGIGLEVMDTPAACRTYNLLMSDERRVSAVIFV